VGVGTSIFGLHRPRPGGGAGVDEHRPVGVAVGAVLVGVDAAPTVVVGADVGTALVVEPAGAGEVLTVPHGDAEWMLLVADGAVTPTRGG
jgi:hypothetical protein